MSDNQSHWNDAYKGKGDSVSWYQPGGSRSLEMIRSVAPMCELSVIDVGAGASRLADDLLAAGCLDLTLLDISDVAIRSAKERIGEANKNVKWVIADLIQWRPSRTWDVWHDRAVFHFLTDRTAQDAYIAALTRATKPGATVIMSTFAVSGPVKCSGLPVHRYSADTLAERLGRDFELFTGVTEQHHTPFGTVQDFIYTEFRRR
jgi:2-polyprenyl-3-methyl-5-hydroxy-6-metoxy-1,4-benzoquinol methylase